MSFSPSPLVFESFRFGGIHTICEQLEPRQRCDTKHKLSASRLRQILGGNGQRAQGQTHPWQPVDQTRSKVSEVRILRIFLNKKIWSGYLPRFFPSFISLQLRINILKTDKAHRCRSSGSESTPRGVETGSRNTHAFELQGEGGPRKWPAWGCTSWTWSMNALYYIYYI